MLPCSEICMSAVFGNRGWHSLCEEQPIALATLWAVWDFYGLLRAINSIVHNIVSVLRALFSDMRLSGRMHFPYYLQTSLAWLSYTLGGFHFTRFLFALQMSLSYNSLFLHSIHQLNFPSILLQLFISPSPNSVHSLPIKSIMFPPPSKLHVSLLVPSSMPNLSICRLNLDVIYLIANIQL